MTKTLLTVLVVGMVLAGAGLLATVVTILSGDQVYGLVMLIGGTTVFAGGLALAGPTDSTTFIPHLLLILAVLGLTVAMGLEHVFSGTQVNGVFYLIVGPGVAVTGGTLYSSRLQKMAAAFHPHEHDPPGALTGAVHPPTPDVPSDDDPDPLDRFATEPLLGTAPPAVPPSGVPDQTPPA